MYLAGDAIITCNTLINMFYNYVLLLLLERLRFFDIDRFQVDNFIENMMAVDQELIAW